MTLTSQKSYGLFPHMRFYRNRQCGITPLRMRVFHIKCSLLLNYNKNSDLLYITDCLMRI